MSINKTLHGVWLTPTPVEWTDDPEMDGQTPDGVRCFITKRGHMRMRVEKRRLKDGITGHKVERFVTLTEADSGFVIKGKANITYDRIHFLNGAIWKRQVEKPPDKQEEARPAPEIQTDAVHSAAPFCGMFCGGKNQPNEPAEPTDTADAAAPPDLPSPKSLDEGFFNELQVQGLVDRINDAIGFWGVSEDTEREYLEKPVLMMNKVVKTAMNSFLENPIIELFQYFMDEAMSMADKAKALGHYLHKSFVQPLTEKMMAMLEEQYSAISWIEGKVHKMVAMMAQMVADQLMGKVVEQLNDAEVNDLEDADLDTAGDGTE